MPQIRGAAEKLVSSVLPNGRTAALLRGAVRVASSPSSAGQRMRRRPAISCRRSSSCPTGGRPPAPDDRGQDGSGDRDRGLQLAHALREAAVPLAQEGVGLGRSRCRLSQDAFRVGMAPAGTSRAALGAGLDGAGRDLRPRHRCPAVGNWAMFKPPSAMIVWAPPIQIPVTLSSRSTAGSGAWSASSAPGQVDEGPPVVRRVLHHHSLDALPGELAGQLQDAPVVEATTSAAWQPFRGARARTGLAPA
jgi:hypothetical protein